MATHEIKLGLDAKDWPETHDKDPAKSRAATARIAVHGEMYDVPRLRRARIFTELKERGKGLLFPNGESEVDRHLLRKIKDEVGDCVQGIKLHRWRDTYITNKLRDGIDIVTVATWAGHDDINVTRSYAAWLDSQSKAARDSANREETRYLKTGTQGD